MLVTCKGNEVLEQILISYSSTEVLAMRQCHASDPITLSLEEFFSGVESKKGELSLSPFMISENKINFSFGFEKLI